MKWQDVRSLLAGGGVSIIVLFSALFMLTGVSETHSGDIVCGDTCESYVNVTTKYWRICFANYDNTKYQDEILFKKQVRSRTLHVNLAKIDNIILTEPKVTVDWLVSARGKDNWRPIKDGDCWDRGKINKIKLVGHKQPTQSVKWSFILGDKIDIDPMWLEGQQNDINIELGSIVTVNVSEDYNDYLEDMEDLTNWTKGGTTNMTINNAEYFEGSHAINIWGTNTYFYIYNDLNATYDFTNFLFNIAVYVKDTATLNKLDTANLKGYGVFMLDIGDTTTSNFRFRALNLSVGWNVLEWNHTDYYTSRGNVDITNIDLIQPIFVADQVGETFAEGDLIIDIFNATARVCIDINHPDYGNNYLCNFSTILFDLNITYFNNSLIDSNLSSKQLIFGAEGENESFNITAHRYDEFVNLTFNAIGERGSWWCYQETANVSTDCGGLNTGSYSSAGNWNDGDWGTCQSVIGYKYVNYTKITNLTNENKWMLNHSIGGFIPAHFIVLNYTIPTTCSLSTIQLRTHGYHNNTLKQDVIDKECYDGASWINLGTTHTTTQSICEEAMWWDVIGKYPSDIKLYVNSTFDKLYTGTLYDEYFSINNVTDGSTSVFFNRTIIASYPYKWPIGSIKEKKINITKRNMDSFTMNITGNYHEELIQTANQDYNDNHFRGSAVTYQGAIYVIGGYSYINTTATNVTEKYTEVTDTWTKLADYPYKARGVACEVYGDFIYCFGGIDNYGNYKHNAYKYNISEDKWSQLLNLPLYFAYSTASNGNISSNKIWLFGGQNATHTQMKCTYEYNIGSNSYTKKTDIPEVLGHSLSKTEAKDGLIYYFAGYSTSFANADETYMYNTSDNTFTAKTDMSYTAYDFSTGRIDDIILVYGGFMYQPPSWVSGIGVDRLYKYNLTSDTWETLSDKNPYLGYVRGYPSSEIDESIYLVGGFPANHLIDERSELLILNKYPEDVFVALNLSNKDYESTGELTQSNGTITVTFNTTQLNNILNDCNEDDNGVCEVSVYFGSTTPGNISWSGIDLRHSNEIEVSKSLFDTYQNTTTDFFNLSLTLNSVTHGKVTINPLNYYYAGGNQTFLVNAHNADYSSETKYNLTAYYSNWDYAFPSYVDYMEFIPNKPTDDNITPFGQSGSVPIFNISAYNYDSKQFNLSIYLNETYSCVDLIYNTNSTKPGLDSGSASGWTGSPQSVSQTNNTDANIVDNSDSFSNHTTIIITDHINITDLDVYVGIVHTYISDLMVTLVHPDGTNDTLHNKTGGGADNITQWYTNRDTFYNKTANGTWGLWVGDWSGMDVGYIDTWSLNITGNTWSSGNASQSNVLGASWTTVLIDQEYLNNSGIWLWADMDCNYSSWKWWQPDLYFKACCEGCICDEDLT